MRFFRFIMIFFAFFGLFHSSLYGFDKKATHKPLLVQKGEQKEWCPVCGMKLESFYKTSHSATLPSGEKRQYCSIRCLAVDMQEYKIDLATVFVVDAKTEELIKAQKAFYVLGAKVAGTMSKKSKFAFAKEADAKEFMTEYAGELVSFEVALVEAQNSLADDMAMTQNKKEKKVYPMGKNIFEKMCHKEIDLYSFIEINQLKVALKSGEYCKPMAEKQLQPLALYLWEVKRFEHLKSLGETIEVAQDEKCPVCGMFVAKYPRWAAQIFYTNKHYSFDGVKDLMKFYFEPQKWGEYPEATQKNITKILVTDYYTQKAIDATKAFYVLGSDIYGPMGNELIPFEKQKDAKTFYMDHKGGKILPFNEITKEDVYELDK